MQKTDWKGARVDECCPIRRLRHDDNSDWCDGRGDGEEWTGVVEGETNDFVMD